MPGRAHRRRGSGAAVTSVTSVGSAAPAHAPSASPSPVEADKAVRGALDALRGTLGRYTVAVEDLAGLDAAGYGADTDAYL